MQPRDDQEHRDRRRHEAERHKHAVGPDVGRSVGDRAHGDGRGVLSLRLRHPERVRNLLEEDDHRDPDGESFDDGPGDVGEQPPEPCDRRADDDHAGHQPHDVHGVRAMLSYQWDEHDGHRAGWTRYLHVGSTEDCSHEPRDDRRHESRGRAQSAGDAEGERERSATTPTETPASASPRHDRRRPA